jgi:hypothetical protein
MWDEDDLDYYNNWDDDEDECDEFCETCYPDLTTKPKETQKKATKMQFINHIISGNSITVFLDGIGCKIFPNTHLFYKEICEAVKKGDKSGLEALLKPQNRNGLEVLEDEVLWNGEPINSVAAQRLFEIKTAGFDTTPVINFLKNCQMNPFPDVVNKLYEFLETRGMPLTEDGCFIGYKYTNEDYWDNYTGSTYKFTPYTHVVATNIENRDTVHDLSGEECSGQGIHVGNFEYSGSYKTVVYVKVNPKDVLSVPVGYGAKKIRVWELDVLGRVDGVKLEEDVVTNEGKKIDFIVGNSLHCRYKAENGEIQISGDILNVGKTYLELENAEVFNEKVCNYWYSLGEKRRLKISNILEIM